MLSRIGRTLARSAMAKKAPTVLRFNKQYMTRSTTFKCNKYLMNTQFLVRAYSSEHHPLTVEDIETRIINCMKQFNKIDPETVTAKSHFQSDLGLDSLETIDVIMLIEDEFSIEIPDVEMEKIQTVEDAISFIASNPHAK